MKKLFRKKKKSASEAGSLAGSLSNFGYDISPKKDLPKLHKAAYEGDLTKIKQLLKKGSNINEVDKENRTPLHIACSKGKIDVIRTLTSYSKIKLNLTDKEGKTCVMKCIQFELKSCLGVLLKKGAELSSTDINGNTALHLAVSIPNEEITTMLLDFGIDIDTTNKDESTPLHVAASVEKSQGVIKMLLREKANVNAKNKEGRTALMIAASRGNTPAVKQLLEVDCDALIEDCKGFTATDLANSNGHHPLSFIIGEYVSEQHKSVPNSRPSSSQKITSVHDISRVSSAHSSTKFSASPFIAGPFTENDKFSSSSSSHSVSENKVKEDEHGDLWDITDEDISNSFSDHEEKKAVNVMQFLKQQHEKKKLSEDSPTAKKPPTPTKVPVQRKPSNSWSVSSDLSSEDDDNKKTFFHDNKTSTPIPTDYQQKNIESDTKIQSDLGIKSNEKSANTSLKTKNFNWDSSDDDSSSADGLGPNAYVPSVQKKEPTKEVDFGTGVASESSSTSSKRSVTSSCTEESDWDSDMEDCESMENYETKNNDTIDALNEASKLKFDDEKDEFINEITVENNIKKEKEINSTHLSTTELKSNLDTNTETLNHETKLNSPTKINEIENLEQKSEINHTSSATLHEPILLDQMTLSGKLDQIQTLDANNKTKVVTSNSLVKQNNSPLKYTLIAENVKLNEEKDDSSAKNLSELQCHDQKLIITGDQKPANLVTNNNVVEDKILNSSANSVLSKTASFLIDDTGSQSLLSSSTTSESESASDHEQNKVEPQLIIKAQHVSSAFAVSPESSAIRSPEKKLETVLPNHTKVYSSSLNGNSVEESENVDVGELTFEAQDKEQLLSFIRQLRFEIAAIKEREKTWELETEGERKRCLVFKEELGVERDLRRKMEIDLRNVRHDLQRLKQNFDNVEEEHTRLQAELEEEKRMSKIKDKLEFESDKVQKLTQKESIDALNLMLEEKDQLISKIMFEKETLQKNNIRYKQDLEQLQNESGDSSEILSKLNMELNNKIDELSRDKYELEELMKHNTSHYKQQFEDFQHQIYDINSKFELEIEAKQKVTNELNTIKISYEKCKSNYNESEVKLQTIEDSREKNEKTLEKVINERDTLLKNLHESELTGSGRQHELNSARTSLTMKEHEVRKLEEKVKKEEEESRSKEKQLQECRVEVASMQGKIESLKIELCNANSEKLQLKSELDSAKCSESVGYNEQQDKFTKIMSDTNREMIELEKSNSVLREQVNHLKEELEKVVKIKLEKESELAFAQQDRIEQCKVLSFTESSMNQLSENQKKILEEKQKTNEKNQQLQKQVQELSLKIKEIELSYERKNSAKEMEHVRQLESLKLELGDKIKFIQNELNTNKIEKDRLLNEVVELKSLNVKHLKVAESAESSRAELEKQLSKFSGDIRDMKNDVRDRDERIKLLETEVRSHMEAGEGELKRRVELNAQLQKFHGEKEDYERKLNQYKEKLNASMEEGKTMEARNMMHDKKMQLMLEELQSTKRISVSQQQLEHESQLLITSQSQKELLSKKVDDMQRDLTKLEDKCLKQEAKIQQLNSEKFQLQNQIDLFDCEKKDNHNFEKVKKLSEEVSFLKRQLEEEKSQFKSNSLRNEVDFRRIVSSEVNAKLDQVNNFLQVCFKHSTDQECSNWGKHSNGVLTKLNKQDFSKNNYCVTLNN